MKYAVVEKMEIRDWAKNHETVGTFTGVIHWLTDCEVCLVECGNFQFLKRPIKRYNSKNLHVDECVSGDKPYCLFFK